jgi:hypothetical protein
MISYQDYLKLLRDKNILLYDFQKRISYSRFKNLIDQKGGGDPNYKINESNKLLSLERHNLEKVIILLNNKDLDTARTIINNFS